MTNHLYPSLPERINGSVGHKPRNVRPPRRMWRVRWTRARWRLDSTGSVPWNTRWFATESAAVRRAERLEADGCQVELAVFNTTPKQVLRYGRSWR